MSAVLRWCDTAGTFVLQAVDHPARQQLLEQWSRYAVMRSIKIELYVHGLEWETRLCFIFECANRKSLHHINQLFFGEDSGFWCMLGYLTLQKKETSQKNPRPFRCFFNFGSTGMCSTMVCNTCLSFGLYAVRYAIRRTFLPIPSLAQRWLWFLGSRALERPAIPYRTRRGLQVPSFLCN